MSGILQTLARLLGELIILWGGDHREQGRVTRESWVLGPALLKLFHETGRCWTAQGQHVSSWWHILCSGCFGFIVTSLWASSMHFGVFTKFSHCSFNICCVCSWSVVCDSWQPHGLQPAKLLSPWDFPGKNTGVGCHFLLQGIFSTQGSNSGLPHWQKDSLSLVPPEATTQFSTVQFSSVAQLCPTLYDPMDCSTPDLPVHHQLPEFTQTHVHWVSDAIQPSHPLLSPSPPAFNLPQHQGLFQWVSSSHQVAKVLEFQLQHQSFQWTPRTDFL